MLVFKHSFFLVLNKSKATDMYICFGMYLPSLKETYNPYIFTLLTPINAQISKVCYPI